MAHLVSKNLFMVFNLSAIIICWYSLNFHSSHLFYIVSSLNICISFAHYFNGASQSLTVSSHIYRLIKAFSSNCSKSFTFIPILFVLIYFTSIHVHTLQLQQVFYHSCLLSLLITFPVNNVNLLRLIFCINLLPTTTKVKTQERNLVENRFVLYNFLLVISMSWFFAFAGGLDRNIRFAHYPVSSCLGALIGSFGANLISAVSNWH